MDDLLNYEPSTKMLDALKEKFSDESLIAADADFGLYLRSRELNYYNVCDVLKMLLSIEDISSMQPYSKIIQKNVIVQQQRTLSYYLEPSNTVLHVKDILTPNMDEIVLIPRESSSGLQSEDILALMPHIHEHTKCGTSNHRHVAEVTNVTHKAVTFQFKNETPCKLRNDIRYDVVFRAPRIPVRLMYNALTMLGKDSDLRRYLFAMPQTINPQPKPLANQLNSLNLFNNSIASNAEQYQAVKQIVAGPNPQAPYIVFGPPGTGKTTTIVEAILQLYMGGNSRILVTAGSNSACDTIASKLILTKTNFTRFYSSSYNGKNKRSLLKKNSIRLTNKELAQGKLWEYKIVVATLCSAGRIYICSQHDRFDYVFIDEAAASTEAETLMGVLFKTRGPCHIILSGDNKQLGPVIKNDRAASLGLGSSLMDRLLLHKLYEVDQKGNYDQTLQTRLRRNYRSHPEIVNIYNKLYYNGELIPLAPLSQVSQAENWKVLPNGKFPILFQEVMGVTERKAYSTSSINKREAEVVCWMVMKLLCDGLGHGVEVKEEDIGIVTPYLAQSKLINWKLRERNQKNVDVGSVEIFQGREKNIIIVSMVSSFKTTQFLSNPRRMNVMLSRAKSLMILIGNPITLNEKKDFEFIIDQCKSKGNFFSQESVEADIKENFERKFAEYRKLKDNDRDMDRLNAKFMKLGRINIF